MDEEFLKQCADCVYFSASPLTCTNVLKKACRLYAASWVRDIGPDLMPDEYKKQEADGYKSNKENCRSKDEEYSTLEDLAVAARGGMETLKPALQRVYMTRDDAMVILLFADKIER